MPADGAKKICADMPLRITLPVTAKTNQGFIRILDEKGAEVDAFDVAVSPQTNVIANAKFSYFPIVTESNVATIYPRCGVMAGGAKYRVTVDAGAFEGVTNPIAWSFTTKDAPKPGKRPLVVAADGSGDFCTVQGAVDFLPEGSTDAVEIFIRNGVYQEIVFVTNRHNITFRGEDRKRTVIQYANNDNLNAKGLRKNVYRQMFGVDGDGITIENLTMRNTTRKGGSQAEALRVDGDRVTLRGCDFYSLQDTLKMSGRVFIADCYIEGDVDFIWGFGTCWFTNCEIKSVNGGYVTQIRNTATNYGDVFVDCRLTGAPGVSNVPLSRIEVNRFPHSHVAFINCAMGPHIKPQGWVYTPGTNSTETLRFWEFQTTDLSGKPLDTGSRTNLSRQVTADEAAQMRDAGHVLRGWKPN